ncbi:hypothetical protein F2981_27880 (plasmid) [Sinorhizobium meliloti]|nr:hypothetical protein [Sinorhizobium meliloti]
MIDVTERNLCRRTSVLAAPQDHAHAHIASVTQPDTRPVRSSRTSSAIARPRPDRLVDRSRGY